VRAKAELLEALPPGGVAIVPANVPGLVPHVPAGVEIRLVEPVDVQVRDGLAHVRFAGRDVVFSFAARHQAANAATALTVCEVLGVPLPEGVVDVTFSRWRSQESELPGGGLLLNDAWNANPVAMEAALAYLRDRAAGRRTVAILGEMTELGSAARGFHEEVDTSGIDLVVGVGELARAYEPDEWVADAAAAVQLAREVVRPGDVVLVKGSRSVGLEIVAEALSGVAAQ
jgi:UDP-N-acetylmuramoyl-tripeptide--D-alanyl-D-alanine ligase